MQRPRHKVTKNHKDGRKVTRSSCHFFSLSSCRLLSLQGVLLALALSLAVGAAPAHAHGGGRAQLTDVPVGPYQVFVWTSPDPWRVGDAHTTVAVTRLLGDGQAMPVEGAQVRVTYAPVGKPGEMQQMAAVERGGTQPGFYEVDAEVAHTGDWEIRIEVSGPEGSGSTAFTTQVLPAQGFNGWLVGGAALMVLVGIGFLGTRPRKARRSKAGVAGSVARSKS